MPGLIAHLAGNLVRNEARGLLTELARAHADTAPASVAEAATAPRSTPEASPPLVQEPAPYLEDAWIFSALAGTVLSGDEQLQLSLQLSRRIGRLELAAGARFGYGRVDARVRELSGARSDRRVSSYQVTLPLSAEFRLLGRDEGYLQLGGYVGYRLAGFMNQSESVTSGSDGDAAYGVQATVGFQLAPTHGFVLRLLWELAPDVHSVSSSDGDYTLDPLAPIAQIGWQIGW
jgi:hypothetical protein